MNQDDRVLFDPSNFDQPNPGGEDSSGQATRVHNRHRMRKVGDGPLICDNSVPESTAGITEDLPSINPSDKGSEGSLVLEFG